jgi:DNA-binding MarR family transcriptional regulator
MAMDDESPQPHSSFDLERFPGRVIGRTAGLLSRYVNQEMEKHGVTLEQWIILAHLVREEGQTQYQLARKCLKTKGTITHLLDHLERRRLVERRPHPEDRRSKEIYLTTEGRSMQERLNRTARACIDHVTRDLPTKDLETTYRTLEQIMERLQQMHS